MKSLRIAVSQINVKVGSLVDNRNLIIREMKRAVETGADILAMPELALTGYPPEDLVFKPDFIDANLRELNEIASASAGMDLLVFVGFINRREDISNSAAVIYNGKIVDIYDKIYLPNYGVFDEKRYFLPGREVPVYHFRGVRIGLNICEDIWYPLGPGHYQAGPGNAEIIFNLSASPYHIGKQAYREKMYSARSGDESIYLVNTNLVGGQDELVFDGSSTAYDPRGNLIMRMKSFDEDFQTFDVNISRVFRERLKDIRRREILRSGESPYPIRELTIDSKETTKSKEIVPVIENELTDIESVYKALVLGTRDYVNKNGFENVIIAISGGIDSALVAALAVDALGPERIKGIYLPSSFSADISAEDARKLCENIGVGLLEMPIQSLFESYNKKLEAVFKDMPFGIAEENLQSRIRGNIVMAISNKFGWMVLTTGNKSEMSTGYATLYGDMAGGFAVIKDVIKTRVYELAEFINRNEEIIPRRIIDRPPSAELRPDQKDTDSLPDYAVLDEIIRAYVEDDEPVEEIVRRIGDPSLVNGIIRLIDRNEYKRRQAPPGIKITPRAFGRDRRMPITNGNSQ